MPRGDKTGPAGTGEMSGRARGYCTGNSVPGYMNTCCRKGLGGGQGFGRKMGREIGAGKGLGQRNGQGFGKRFWTTPEEMIQANKEPTQKELLDELKSEKARIEKAIKKLEKKKK
jgi:hypothetical protein